MYRRGVFKTNKLSALGMETARMPLQSEQAALGKRHPPEAGRVSWRRPGTEGALGRGASTREGPEPRQSLECWRNSTPALWLERSDRGKATRGAAEAMGSGQELVAL